MAQVIKLKRSSTASSVPTISDLEIGEVAVNSADRKIYIRTASAVSAIANYAEVDDALTFPVGDYGLITDSLETDAFGQALSRQYDMLDTPTNALSLQDLGGL